MSGQRRLFRTRRARRDLIEIWEQIAADNPAAADALLDRIDDACSRLIDHPRLGPARDDIRSGLRYVIVGDYVAFIALSMRALKSSASSTVGAICSICEVSRSANHMLTA
jgi:toxin ParE1/3/4